MKKILKLFTAALLSLGILTGVALPQGIVPTAPQNVAYAKTTPIKVTSALLSVNHGAYASITVKGKARSRATISVYYNSGLSRSTTLYPKTSNGAGYVSWRWKVGTRTAPGTYPVNIMVGGKSIHETLRVQ